MFNNLKWEMHPRGYPYTMASVTFPNGIQLSFLGRGSSIYTDAPDMYECLIIVPDDYNVMQTSILGALVADDPLHGTSAEMQKIIELVEMQPVGGHQQRSIK